ncbi:MAG: hypothetical protein JXA17_03930 [Dehalococcoidales bacterium]|nr:hypothetical protein [Dehalococcoidales bacterium]
MQLQFKKYLIRLLIITLLLLVLIGGFNWLVDPYDIYYSPKIAGFNALKPEEITHTLMTKAYAVQQLKSEGIILGTSAAQWGIDPDHQGWSYQPVYNLGLPGANVYTMFRYLQHANDIQPLKQVVIGLDFDSFNIHHLAMAADAEVRLSVSYEGEKNSSLRRFDDIIATLFSLDALISSINTVTHQKGTLRIKDNGMYEIAEQDPTNLNGYHGINSYHGIFSYEEGTYANDSSFHDDFRFSNATTDIPPFTYYRQMLQFAYSNNIDLRLFISPSHARLWELFDNFGLLPDIEAWKRILVAINEEEARNYGSEPFPLWDFSGYNEFTIEAVPVAGDTETMMHWWIDPRHYNKELGDFILDRIFGYYGPSHTMRTDFGVLLNSANIDSVLQKIREDRQYYRDTHPEDVAEIDALFE